MDWVEVRVRWGMYDVRVCVAAKVRMIAKCSAKVLFAGFLGILSFKV